MKCVFRPLTQEEIAQRREMARQRHAERMTADQTTVESQKNLARLGSKPQEGEAAGIDIGKFSSPKTRSSWAEHSRLSLQIFLTGAVKVQILHKGLKKQNIK